MSNIVKAFVSLIALLITTTPVYAQYGVIDEPAYEPGLLQVKLDCINANVNDVVDAPTGLAGVDTLSVTFKNSVVCADITFTISTAAALIDILPTSYSPFYIITFDYENVAKSDMDFTIVSELKTDVVNKFSNIKSYVFNSPAQEVGLTNIGQFGTNTRFSSQISASSQYVIAGTGATIRTGSDSNVVTIVAISLLLGVIGVSAVLNLKKK